MTLEATIDETEHYRPVQYVDATQVLNDLRRDLRGVRRCLAVQSVMLAIVLAVNLIAPLAVILSTSTSH